MCRDVDRSLVEGSGIADGMDYDVVESSDDADGTNLDVVGVGTNLDDEVGVDASPNHAYPRGHCVLGGVGANLSKDQIA